MNLKISVYQLLLSLSLFCQLFSTGLACIGFGGCALLGYPSYRCQSAYYAPYYPTAAGVGGCYGGFCRNRAKGSRVMALNESAAENTGEAEAGGVGEFTEERPAADAGKSVAAGLGASAQQRQRLRNGFGQQERDGFGASEQVSPDALFFECCQSWSLPPQCLLKCSFANYSAETLRSMFLRTDGCPIESASIIHFCASQNQDHRQCCLQADIDKSRAGEKCLIFCDQMPENETRLDLSYLPCFERFSDMKKCFYENALRTIDYLEAELDEIRKEQANEDGERDGGFAIGRPPIIFVNDIRPKHPQINDDYFDDLLESREGQDGEEERNNIGGLEERTLIRK